MRIFTSLVACSMLLALVGLAPIPQARAAANAGDLIKCADYSSVYYLADDGERWVFPNEKTYFTWYTDFDDVVEITCEELASYDIGENVTYRPGTRLVKIQSINKVYAVEPGGVLRWIVTQSQAENLYGATWNTRIDDVPVGFWTSYTEGNTLPWGEYPTGSILQSEDSGFYYYVQIDDTINRVSVSFLDAIRQTYAVEVTHDYLVSLEAGQAEEITEEELEELEEIESEPEIEELTEEEEEQIEEAEAEAEAEEIPEVVEEEVEEEEPAEEEVEEENPFEELIEEYLLEIEVEVPETPVLSLNQVDGLNSATINLSWNLVDLYSTYTLQEDTNASFTSPTTLLDEEMDLSYTVSETVNETTTFYYRVKATNEAGVSDWASTSATVTYTEDPYYIISGVPDADQPPSNYFFASNTDNWSAGMAAANVLYYLDSIDYAYTDGISANLTPSQMAAAIGYLMDINNIGSSHRGNIGWVHGTLNSDLVDGIDEYAIWEGDSPTDYGFPVPGGVSNKSNYYGWEYTEYDSGYVADTTGWYYITQQLDDGMPVFVTFNYWNPVGDLYNLDDIYFYDWGADIDTADDATIPGPDESWTNGGVGHAVTAVGYLEDYDIGDGGGEQDWLIVHDNWSNTEENVAIPWNNWDYMIVAEPGPDVLPAETTTMHDFPAYNVDSGETFEMSWYPVSNATRYKIEWDTDGNFGSPQELDTDTGSLDYTYSTSHTPGKVARTYYYRIKPMNYVGHGDWSPTYSVTVNP